MRKLLMISTDRKIFEEGSAVRARQVEYAKEWDEVHIVVFDKVKSSKLKVQSESQQELTVNTETVIAPNCWAYSTQSWTKFMYPFNAISLGRFLVEKRGITNITTQDASLTAMAGLSLKKQFHVPIEIQVHNDIGSPYFAFNITNKIRKTLALSYLPKADSVRVVSNKIKEYLINTVGIAESKITVKPIFVDTEKIKAAPILPGADLRKKYPQFEKIVLVVARLEPEKNVKLALEVWSGVVKAIPGAGLVIVGEGSQKGTLDDFVSRRGLEASVIFEPWAKPGTLFSYYKTTDVFFVPSLFEGYGMTLIEAQAAGCKIISTDVGVAREVGATIVGWNKEKVSCAIIDALK